MTDRREMFYGANANAFKKAGELRTSMTPSELALWEELKGKKLGLKFRRQHPIGHFIADFYCHELKLVVEVDGEIHQQKDQAEYDQGRDYEMKELGLNIIRLSNDQIRKDINGSVNKIKDKCQKLQKSLPRP